MSRDIARISRVGNWQRMGPDYSTVLRDPAISEAVPFARLPSDLFYPAFSYTKHTP